MEMWGIVRDKSASEQGRVKAARLICEIRMYIAKDLEDLKRGMGWFIEEYEYLEETGKVPPRIAVLTGRITTEDIAKDFNQRRSLREEKQAASTASIC